MSRIGRMQIAIPAGVTVDVADGNVVTVKGPKGTLTQRLHPEMAIEIDGGFAHVKRPSDDKEHKGASRTDPFASEQYGRRCDRGL